MPIDIRQICIEISREFLLIASITFTTQFKLFPNSLVAPGLIATSARVYRVEILITK